jgi:hypothetical protein
MFSRFGSFSVRTAPFRIQLFIFKRDSLALYLFNQPNLTFYTWLSWLPEQQIGINMRSILFLAILATPFSMACDNPDSDACASVFTASSAVVETFCKTYTTTSHTATTSLPAFASYCSNKPAKLSSACSCLVPGTAVTTTTSSVSRLLKEINEQVLKIASR